MIFQVAGVFELLGANVAGANIYIMNSINVLHHIETSGESFATVATN